MSDESVYLQQVHRVLPRVRAMFDVNPLSPGRGLGDRLHWSWKLIDFANATPQGLARGLAGLIAHDLLPAPMSAAVVLSRIDEMFAAVASITRRDDSLEEAFPWESSFCATAQVALDLCRAVEHLDHRLDEAMRSRWVDIIAPLVRYLLRREETHGFISNHLACAAAACQRWHALTGDRATRQRAAQLLGRVLDAQSEEGWYPEYGGADPGYQSLCMHHLSLLVHTDLDDRLNQSLMNSAAFMAYCVQPDGSFGGLYGSRQTRLWYPGGLERLAPSSPDANAISRFMRRSIEAQRTPTLDTMDAPNLAAMFNAYVDAAIAVHTRDAEPACSALPHEETRPWRRELPQAGLVFDNGPGHYTIVSRTRGGVVQHYRKREDGFASAALVDAGRVVQSSRGRIFTTQAWRNENDLIIDGDEVRITAPFSRVRLELPCPWKFLVLRAMCQTIMRIPFVRARIKRWLVRRLITGRREIPLRNQRVIRLGRDLELFDALEGSRDGYEIMPVDAPFIAIHMASAGYWQAQDDAPGPV